MFIKTDKKTLQQEVIDSEKMAEILESDMKATFVDEALTDMVLGTYEHGNRFFTFKYKW